MFSYKELLKKLGFFPKENENEVFCKKFFDFDGYTIEVDFQKNKLDFGPKIKSESTITQNFSQEENLVVLECVNRLLEKGYKPEDITLEKTWKTGHGTSGRLDILIEKDKKAYLMIECKTWGNEFEKELKKIQKDGGQLFTYFQQDKNAEYLMLYTSQLSGQDVDYKNEIIKIEEHYREAGNVKDFYDRWNKLTKQNGIFDDWVSAYQFQGKALTKNDLNIIKQEDSSFIFNRFLEILRHNVVSDKPNAFNKIFTLFLCKIIDETHAKGNQLDFQWVEGIDDNISFQKRLTDLYKSGMKELLNKEVKDLTDDEFRRKFSGISEDDREKILKEFTEIRLKKNNEFAFKEVFDDPSFEDNAKVVKEVVELLQGYQLRYNQKHQYLSDFFELLLTTGLKQESGQFFTPVPVAKYIIKSIPIKEVINKKVKEGNSNDLLPFIIDYAAGSGHFLTESMDEVQKIIDKIDESKSNQQVEKTIRAWRENQFSWAIDYVYGIEKDYRLVKTAKVSCYLHGDGLAKVIHGDGLQTFGIEPLDQGNLKEFNSYFHQDNKQFDIVISNPPYSVSAFKGTLNEENAKNSFELFSRLTDQSSEIECLFIERTKQLLKDGGFAGIILPSSILSNAGIYTKTREVLFKYFKIVAITELGSSTFMATGTNTVILFLHRRTNYEWENIQSSVENFFQNHKDITINGIENAFSEYVKHVWGGSSTEDYASLCQNKPNDKIRKHDVYREYEKKIKAKDEEEKLKIILEIEKEKLLYFILAYPQKIIIVKSGKQKEEKAFLGYEFSSRRGYEGIHPIQRSKSIDECTKMFDPISQENPEKASFYVYKAFLGELDLEVEESMKKHVFQTNLVDMMTFDRVDFEKTISLTLKKTLKIESKWGIARLGDISKIDWGNTNLTKTIFRENGKYDVFSATGRDGKTDSFEQDGDAIILSAIGARCGKCFWATGKWTAIKNTIVIKTQDDTLLKYLFQLINNEDFWDKSGKAQPFITLESANNQKIPFPPKNTQEKIVIEIEKIEGKEKVLFSKIKILEDEIKKHLISSPKSKDVKIGDILTLEYGSALTEKDRVSGEYPVMGSNGIVGYHNNFTVKGPTIIIGRKGSAGKVIWIEKNNYPIDTAFYVKKINGATDYKFIYYVLRDIDLEKLALGAGVPGLNRNDVYNQIYKLPSFEEQQKIVAKIVKIEEQVIKFNQELKEIKNQKAEVLKKYL
ncbi:MAG: restriction endonuclease subunit S [bacterium]|nr:restriction endonuclease subunit S [bacterium]